MVELRLRPGDFEGDTVPGPAGTGGASTGGAGTLVDRKSRLMIILKIQSRDADHVHESIKRRLKELDEERCHSLTFDHGGEFARCRLERQMGMERCFADPGGPLQRGTNERTNGLIRWYFPNLYFPKGIDFRAISPAEVRRVQELRNTRPRACPDFLTSAEVFFEKPLCAVAIEI